MRPARRRGLIGIIVVMIAVAGWVVLSRHARALRAVPASLTVQWQGKYPGSMTLPARLRWCPVTRIGDLEAISGDSGVAIVLYEPNTIAAAVHPIASPDVAASASRPGATAAMRWMRFDHDSELAEFRAQSGSVRLRLAGGLVSGDMVMHMRAATGPDTLLVRGDFRDVPMVTTAVGCT